MKPEAPCPKGLDPRRLLEALDALRDGDFSVRLPESGRGLAGKIQRAVNEIAERQQALGAELARVAGAVAKGDLSQEVSLDAGGRPLRGELLRTARVVNAMVDQLAAFAFEVTRVAREVGAEGKLGAPAVVRNASGTWKDLADAVNAMASNLAAQVRSIAAVTEVTTAVANGDLSKKITVDVKGEILELKNTMNGMVDQLSSFASEVTRVAREVGTEGKLGGQAKVPGAAGTWRDLTDNVNQLAANLTTQVRAIAEVATAVTKGDLTRSISVTAQGEVAALKDNINQMIANLRGTTQKNAEQDWLKTNLAKFTRMLQGQRDLEAVTRLVLRELAPLVSAQHGVFYVLEGEGESALLKLVSSYAFRERKGLGSQFRVGEGLVGQCVVEKERILLTDVPENYVRITSGLGDAKPLNIVVLPVLFEGQVKAVIELASFYRFNEIHLAFLDQLTESIGIVLNTIAASTRTEELLKQSQSLADELRSQQGELTETNRRLEQQARTLKASEERLKQQQEQLQHTNEELEGRSRLLQDQNVEVERKNREIEQAKRALEERAQQLALSSRYKSEFLANMSHELRTPLNSMLILSKLLADNEEGKLSQKQVEFAQTIHSSGADLLSLINDILDLAKIESGTMAVEREEVVLDRVREFVVRTFGQLAEDKGLRFEVALDEDLPRAVVSDGRRVQQVLKNLLSNAFKFTERGEVRLRVFRADGARIGFSVSDTGIGIPEEKQRIIFEAFQQADGTTSRRYGGTGLGLSISREIARLLGGEIQVRSAPGAGSTFTLLVPQALSPAPKARPAATSLAASLEAASAPTPSPEPGDPEPAFLGANELDDDRDRLQPGDRVLLIAEDDLVFARVLLGLARDCGFRAVVALRGDAALALARRYPPDAIALDVGLPGVDGWSVLDRLKHDPATRHVPVQIITAGEEPPRRGLLLGAIGRLQKPASKESVAEALAALKRFCERRVKSLLLVDGDEAQRGAAARLIGNGDVSTTPVATAAEAVEAASSARFDCAVVALPVAGAKLAELVERLTAEGRAELPIVVYARGEPSPEDEAALKQLRGSRVVKTARSAEQLLDETALFLHRADANLPDEKRQMIRSVQRQDPVLAGRKVLVVDDDVRNIFALTSVLERQQMQVLFAENGKKGVELIRRTPDLDVVLMDVMMPEMDGLETMRAVRQMEDRAALPIIALTAKAMKGDRERCLQAGASDYITKPVDTEQLLSMLRVWAARA